MIDMKGGHARSGPAPDPNALRRDRDQGEWTVLPAEGRKGRPPEWPLTEPSERELELWRKMWTKPQALMWSRLGQQFEVALLVRNLAQVEQPDSPVNLGTLVRQQMDSLGMTTPGLRSNRWRIARDEVAAKRTEHAATPAAASARDRLKMVRSAGSAG
jgi:hypothetical protein